MLKQRIATAAALLALFLAANFLLSTFAWGVLILLPIALGAWEWGALAGFSRTGHAIFVAVVVASCVALLFAGAGAATEPAAGVIALSLAAVFWCTVAPIWLLRAWHVRAPTALAGVGWLLLVPCWYGAVVLHRSPAQLLAFLLVVWIADSAAYFVGRRYGRRKLAPAISPGKTWEGVGGAFAAVLMYGLFLQRVLTPDEAGLRGIALYLLLASMTALGIVGDLFESWMKRQAGVKDSGTLLPGHGGVLDRIDALTAAVPLAALWILLGR
ncbi:MAG: phosphatidate cytidylyltransferase [Burkholderiales bacterium]